VVVVKSQQGVSEFWSGSMSFAELISAYFTTRLMRTSWVPVGAAGGRAYRLFVD
jgi:hypothetical protein